MNENGMNKLVGAWKIEATHPAMPGEVVRGEVNVEWLEGQRFLIHRARMDHPDFPDSISIIGDTERDRVANPGDREVSANETHLSMHYFDSRGVFRYYEVAMDDTTWCIWRNARGFSQRFTGAFEGNDVIAGQWQMSEDGQQWKDDLRITYRRAS